VRHEYLYIILPDNEERDDVGKVTQYVRQVIFQKWLYQEYLYTLNIREHSLLIIGQLIDYSENQPAQENASKHTGHFYQGSQYLRNAHRRVTI